MFLAELAGGLAILALVSMGAVKLADKLKIVETIKKWGKKDDASDHE